MSAGSIILIVVGISILGASGIAIGIYNGLITVRNNVQKAWKTIDIVFQQRHDELTKLIDTCKAYMKHERELLTKITELRTGYTMAKEIQEKYA